MSPRFKGGVVSATPPTITSPTGGEGGSASGIWSMTNVLSEEGGSTWPKLLVPKELWMWGHNSNGQLGQGDTTNYSSPVQVGSLTDWQKVVVCEAHTVAVKQDNTLWTWGSNANYGMLGQNDTTSRSSPTQVGALTNWSIPSGGEEHSMVIKTDGTIWGFGKSGSGAIGDGTTTSRSAPVQVGSLTTWSKVGCGGTWSMSIKTDGTLWVWGKNTKGQLGVGDTTAYDEPVQVGSLTDWSAIEGGWEHSLALKTDGTIWAWGENGFGQVGDGSTTDRNSPVQIGSLTTWAAITAGWSFSAAVKTDGTLWAWGEGGHGELGQSNTTHYSSPVQVGSLTTWSTNISAAKYSIAGLTTSGAWWTWGQNEDNGRLGVGDEENTSSPVQVGSLTTWVYITPGGAKQRFRGGLKTV